MIQFLFYKREQLNSHVTIESPYQYVFVETN